MTKKRTLEMMECAEEFVDSEVLQAVHQRTDKVKIARRAKVEEIMVEKRREMQAAEVAATVEALVAMAVAIEKRRTTAIEKRKEREAEADAKAAVAALAVAAVATEKEGDSGGGGGRGGDACGKHIQSVQPRGMHQDETS